VFLKKRGVFHRRGIFPRKFPRPNKITVGKHLTLAIKEKFCKSLYNKRLTPSKNAGAFNFSGLGFDPIIWHILCIKFLMENDGKIKP